MTARSDTFRLYSDLSWLWPLWGDPTTEYARYCDFVAESIRRYARRPVTALLDISCGGGKNVFNLKRRYQVTGLDISPAMLKLAARLNPECESIEGDMRSFSLGRTFDAILMDDGISYMANRADLNASFRTAFLHLNPGGVMVVTPDVTVETFIQNHTESTPALERLKPKGIDVVFIENSFDPDPTDECYDATLLYLIREDGVLRIEEDRFTLGLFSLDVWKQSLAEAGFVVHEDRYVEATNEYTIFSCLRPC